MARKGYGLKTSSCVSTATNFLQRLKFPATILGLKGAVKRLPLAELGILLLQTLLASFKVAVVDPVHSRIGLEHQRLQDSLILDRFRWKDSLDQILTKIDMRNDTLDGRRAIFYMWDVVAFYLRRYSIQLQIS